ncbi:hypothetical protein UY3_04498 [Chelonia mydas]|uniref:Uncharacterized protein n=1 Tax=Chelonia mydas TaxID=8469 RepID=M7BM34_CHEMY|nr:hypothetical protein UY3_04498 [Chelonia mydas]
MGAAERHVPWPTPLPAAPIGLEQRTTASGSRVRPNLRMQQPCFLVLALSRPLALAFGLQPLGKTPAPTTKLGHLEPALLTYQFLELVQKPQV